MTILETFIKLRDDIKTWVTNNLNQKANISYVDQALEGKQPVGDYALKSEIPTDYLTAIPSEYVTESELNAKGYLTEHQSLEGKQDKITGTAGQIVSFDSNGNMVAQDKTHGKEVSESLLFEGNIIYSVAFNEIEGEFSTTPNFTFDKNGVYSVIFNGIKYENLIPHPNIVFFGIGDTEFTDYPFWIGHHDNNSFFVAFVNEIPADTHVTILKIEDTIKQLDEIYIPDTIARLNSVQDKITGTAGDFVIIGEDGNVTTKSIPNAEEATF